MEAIRQFGPSKGLVSMCPPPNMSCDAIRQFGPSKGLVNRLKYHSEYKTFTKHCRYKNIFFLKPYLSVDSATLVRGNRAAKFIL
jgi:hypothetical protein